MLISDSLSQPTDPQIASEGVLNPDEFIVGPGDNFIISIKGVEEFVYNVVINFEGAIYLPKVGSIELKDLSLSNAKSKIVSVIQSNFKNVQVYISLTSIRKIKVGLFGDIKKPNAYSLYANSRLSDLIVLSQGFNTTADLRNIIIKDRNGNVNKVDYLAYVRQGNRSNNPLLNDGDHVFVDKADKMVSVLGSVMFPGIYEFKDKENAYDLINLAGGVLSDAKLDSIEIIRFADDFKRQFSLFYSLDQLKKTNYELKNKDKVVVRTIPEYLVDKIVYVQGYVKYPGIYRIEEDKTKLSEIIKKAGGFLTNASLVDATVTRISSTVEKDPEFERLKFINRADMTDDEYDYYKSRSRQRQGKVVVDFVELFENYDTDEDIVLKKNDVINVPEKKNYITIIGQVVNPGDIPFVEGLHADDYIKLAGGFGWRALEKDVRVIKANTGEWVDADKVDELKPGDTIWVPENPPPPKFWILFKDILTVLGQVATVVAATIAVIVSTRR
jgi:protein involved in polysaccharide export with SLBB domain